MLIRTIEKILEEGRHSLRSLSKELNVSHSWLSQVLNGKREANITLLREVANFTGKSYDYLMSPHRPINPECSIDIELIKELFARRKTDVPFKHIRPLTKRPSKIEQLVLDNIRQVTDFEFTQVTLNLNHQMAPHHHKNDGLSKAILLGDFEGGALCLANGQRFEQKNVWFFFDGAAKHWVEPFCGERISIILYNR